MSEDRRAPGDGPSDERRDWCHVYNAGDGIVEVIADFASHYDAQPDQPWKPKGSTVEEMVAEIDLMAVAFDKALMRSRRLIGFVMER